MINRLIMWLALAGAILALHLWIQKARGFDQGCLGLDSHAAVAMTEGGCKEVGALPASHIFGVSNAAWGYAFYFALAVLSLAKILVPPTWARRLHRVGEIAVAGALLYTIYLVYEMGFVAHAWCVLCLASATIIAALAGLHVALYRRGGFQPVEESSRAGEFRIATAAIFAAAGVLIGVLLFLDRLGTRPLDQGSTRKEFLTLMGQSLPYFIDGEKLREMRACHFDWEAPPLPPGEFSGPPASYVGKADGPEVIVFYDPNCPHCRAYHEGFLRVVESYKDRARFTIRPRLLWDQSIPQVEALKLAEGSGKYLELWRIMFERQPGPKKAMTVAQIAAIFTELGLDPSNLEQRLAAERATVEDETARARAAGIDAVPAIYIGGVKVWGANQSGPCVGALIERVESNH